MIVVTGATGNVGAPLVRVLAAAGERVTAVSRRGAGVEALENVEHRTGDLAAPESLGPAFEGAEALFLLLSGELLAGPASLDRRALLDIAREAGIKRVVLLSSQAAGTRPAVPPYSLLRAAEDDLRASELAWTILRPGGFHSNTFGWAAGVREQKAVAAPFGDVALPFIDPSDIAEVAATVLRDAGHSGQIYELTGPEPVSPREQARAIGDALGTPVRFAEQSRDEARALLVRFMPEAVVDATLDLLGAPSAAERLVSPAVERLLGRPARTYGEWAARNVAAFR
ncbi:NAD(P)H-binding protein [Sinosporangium siamense]|uniref:NmrA family transcriptional regulator n=1 Tax=Sinosporangium siamense TaxID=1367973 RepID=A0A919RAL5_9ACTN|nr:NAD(P)H-binding protein [Sinosporangium siamense]GII89997.1 NmrA family transcriptional regulator [Sinosporangium siamense]